MNDVKLKKIVLKNYMNADYGEWDFFDKTQICGKNAVGKTTLMHAYFDVLTGKLANGNAPSNICPLDGEGKEIPVKEIERTVTLEISGEEREISKITRRKYRKNVFVGNETTYKLDGIPAKATEVTEFINQIAPLDAVSMCSNAAVFFGALKKSTADARKHLEALSGFDLVAFCNSNEEYSRAYEMLKGKPVEDVIKVMKKKLKIENNEIDRLNVELDYERRSLDRMDKSNLEELESEKSALKIQLNGMENLKRNLDEGVDRYTYLLGQANDVKARMGKIEDEQTASDRKSILDIGEQTKLLEQVLDETQEKIYAKKSEVSTNENLIKMNNALLVDINKKVDEIRRKTFSNSEMCPVCGQKIPETMLNEKKKLFEEEKEREISKHKKNIEMANWTINEAQKITTKHVEEIERLSVEQKNNEERLSSLREKLSNLYNSTTFSETEEYTLLKVKLKEIEEQADEISNTGELREQVKDEINSLKIRLSKKEEEIKGVIRSVENGEERIAELSEQVRAKAQIATDIEKNIFLLQEFSIAKNKAIEDLVNSKFEFINLKMSEETLDGTIRETLRIQVDGVDYFGGLNHGDRILAEIYLLKGLQDMNGIRLPIWVDDTESLDSWRVPDIGRQMVMIRRTDDAGLDIKRLED